MNCCRLSCVQVTAVILISLIFTHDVISHQESFRFSVDLMRSCSLEPKQTTSSAPHCEI